MTEMSAAANSDPVASAAGTLDVITRAARAGAADAREAAAKTWAATSLFMCRFVYTACYTVSYGVVFPTTLLAHSVPKNNAAVRGLVDGASCAMADVDRYIGKPADAPAAEHAPA